MSLHYAMAETIVSHNKSHVVRTFIYSQAIDYVNAPSEGPEKAVVLLVGTMLCV